MWRSIVHAAVLFSLALAAGCASVPHTLDTSGVNPLLTPGKVLSDPVAARGNKVLWGGVIVASRNLKDVTQLEVLAHPLDEHSGRPDTAAPARERFLALQAGYLETADYAQGRLLTVVGTVRETREGMVGEAKYVYPVITASQVYLWPKDSGIRTEPQIHFGIGIGISR